MKYFLVIASGELLLLVERVGGAASLWPALVAGAVREGIALSGLRGNYFSSCERTLSRLAPEACLRYWRSFFSRECLHMYVLLCGRTRQLLCRVFCLEVCKEEYGEFLGAPDIAGTYIIDYESIDFVRAFAESQG